MHRGFRERPGPQEDYGTKQIYGGLAKFAIEWKNRRTDPVNLRLFATEWKTDSTMIIEKSVIIIKNKVIYNN